MIFRIYKNGELINRIVADGEFCQKNYSEDGYSYELERAPSIVEEYEPEPTLEEKLRADVDYIAAMVGVLL